MIPWERRQRGGTGRGYESKSKTPGPNTGGEVGIKKTLRKRQSVARIIIYHLLVTERLFNMSRQPHNRSRLCNAVRSGELVPIIQFVLQARFQGFFIFILLFLFPTCVAQTLGKVQRVQKRHFDIDALAPPPPRLCSFWRAFSVKRCRFFHSQKLRRTQVEKQTHRSNQRRSQAESCLSPHQTGAASFISPSQFDSQYSHCSHR